MAATHQANFTPSTYGDYDYVPMPQYVHDIVYYSACIFSPIILFPGLIGNMLILLVLRRKELGTMPTAPYLATLAMADTGGLIFGLGEMWMYYSFGILLRTNTAACRVVPFCLYVTLMTSSWCIVAMTVDRFICIKFPFKARDIRIKHRLVVIVGIVVSIILLNCHMLVFDDFDDSLMACDRDPAYQEFMITVWPWIDASVTSFVPFAVIILCNIGMISEITSHKKLQETDDAVAKESEASRKLTRLLIVISITFLVTTSPVTIVIMLYNVLQTHVVGTYTTTTLVVAQIFTQYLAYTNNAINFLLYCIAGDKFREALKALLRCS